MQAVKNVKKSLGERTLHKEVTAKEDGRYLIYYSWENTVKGKRAVAPGKKGTPEQ